MEYTVKFSCILANIYFLYMRRNPSCRSMSARYKWLLI